jgi:hypothetical protein
MLMSRKRAKAALDGLALARRAGPCRAKDDVEAPRLQDAEEAGLDVLAVGLVGQAPLRLALRLARAQHLAHRCGARRARLG